MYIDLWVWLPCIWINCEGGKINSVVLQTLFLIDTSIGILKYFSPTTGIPSRKDIAIVEVTTHETNRSVKRVLEKQGDQASAKKQKLYTVFSIIDGAEISRYASEHEYCSFAKERSQIT